MSADRSIEERSFWHRLLRVFRYWTNLLLVPLFVQMILETGTGGRKAGWDYNALDLFFCANFFAEWALGLALATDRRRFLKDIGNITDVVSSIPLGYVFQGLRIVRLVRVLRVMRLAFRARRFRDKGGRLVRAAGLVGSITFSGALAFRIVEPESTAGFEEALWSLVPLSTVGYGDVMPATPAGHFIAALVIIAGLGVFGYTAGFMTSMLQDDDEDEILVRVRAIDERLGHLDLAVAKLVATGQAAVAEQAGTKLANPLPAGTATPRRPVQ